MPFWAAGSAPRATISMDGKGIPPRNLDQPANGGNLVNPGRKGDRANARPEPTEMMELLYSRKGRNGPVADLSCTTDRVRCRVAYRPQCRRGPPSNGW